MNYRDQAHIKVLVPDWFDDTVLLGICDLSTESYEWPDPSALKRRTAPAMRLQQAKKPGVWGGCRILLSTTLELTGSRRKIVEDDIRQAQGVLVAYTSKDGDGSSEEELRLLDDCDVFVTRYRTGPAFFKAWREGKKMGTLSWLLSVQVTSIFTSPLDQLLHFPIPRGPVEGFDKHEISITNYTGESREYLKKLVALMGGNFTPSLSTKNTVLVASQKSGSKTSKAEEWSIPVVNHTWLEDCFLRRQSFTPTLPKYISYPAGIDFAGILGERGVGPDIEEIIAAEAAEEGEISRTDQVGHNVSNSTTSDSSSNDCGTPSLFPSSTSFFTRNVNIPPVTKKTKVLYALISH
ncbi:BRCT domain-containing protein [Mycena latifolia]|nr:BRCT domain-containing protein [Mycena latifolia]